MDEPKPEIVELAELGGAAARKIEDLSRAGGAILKGESGEPVAVVLAPADFRQLQKEIDLLRRLALGEIECKAGVGHNLDEVLEECDLLLEEN